LRFPKYLLVQATEDTESEYDFALK